MIAVLANIIVDRIGLISWYDFAPKFFKNPIIAVKEARFLSLLWLFVLYPLTLAFGYIVGDKVSLFLHFFIRNNNFFN